MYYIVLYYIILYSDILCDIISGIYSDILSDILPGRDTLTSYLTCFLSGSVGDMARIAHNPELAEGVAPLLKSRDPQLAGGKT